MIEFGATTSQVIDQENPPLLSAPSNSQVANVNTNNNNTNSTTRARRKKSKLTLCQWVIDPSGWCYNQWSLVVSLAFLYNFWALSYRFAFREINDDTLISWFALDYTADAIYFLDILINHHSGYLENGVLQRNLDKISAHYRESTLFYLDCFCLLPLDILYLSIGYNSVLRISRLVKIYKFWSCVDRTERHTNYPNVFRTVTLVHYILVILHWNSCIFHMVSKNKLIDIENLYKFNSDNRRCDDIQCQYLHAFYWSTLAITTIGDLPRPSTKGEYFYVVVELLFGIFLFASILGHVANIVTNVSAARREFQAKLDSVKTFMRQRRVSEELQKKVIRWFDYLWTSQQSSDEDKSVACLPDRLKAEIAIHVHLDTLKRVDIFQNTEAGFLCELVLRLKPVLFSPGDFVCRKNEVGLEMYIVSRGILEVLTDDSMTVVATLRAGSYFGEISVLNVGLEGNRRTASVRSVGYSDLFCLNKQDLWDVLKNHPNAEARIRARAEERLSKLEIQKQQHHQKPQLQAELASANQMHSFQQSKARNLQQHSNAHASHSASNSFSAMHSTGATSGTIKNHKHQQQHQIYHHHQRLHYSNAGCNLQEGARRNSNSLHELPGCSGSNRKFSEPVTALATTSNSVICRRHAHSKIPATTRQGRGVAKCSWCSLQSQNQRLLVANQREQHSCYLEGASSRSLRLDQTRRHSSKWAAPKQSDCKKSCNNNHNHNKNNNDGADAARVCLDNDNNNNNNNNNNNDNDADDQNNNNNNNNNRSHATRVGRHPQSHNCDGQTVASSSLSMLVMSNEGETMRPICLHDDNNDNAHNRDNDKRLASTLPLVSSDPKNLAIQMQSDLNCWIPPREINQSESSSWSSPTSAASRHNHGDEFNDAGDDDDDDEDANYHWNNQVDLYGHIERVSRQVRATTTARLHDVRKCPHLPAHSSQHGSLRPYAARAHPCEICASSSSPHFPLSSGRHSSNGQAFGESCSQRVRPAASSAHLHQSQSARSNRARQVATARGEHASNLPLDLVIDYARHQEHQQKAASRVGSKLHGQPLNSSTSSANQFAPGTKLHINTDNLLGQIRPTSSNVPAPNVGLINTSFGGACSAPTANSMNLLEKGPKSAQYWPAGSSTANSQTAPQSQDSSITSIGQGVALQPPSQSIPYAAHSADCMSDLSIKNLPNFNRNYNYNYNNNTLKQQQETEFQGGETAFLSASKPPDSPDKRDSRDNRSEAPLGAQDQHQQHHESVSVSHLERVASSRVAPSAPKQVDSSSSSLVCPADFAQVDELGDVEKMKKDNDKSGADSVKLDMEPARDEP